MKFFVDFLLFILLIRISEAAFCGRNTLPHSVKVTETNKLIVKCSKPECLKLGMQKGHHRINNNLCYSNFSSTTQCDDGDGKWINSIVSSTSDLAELNVTCCQNDVLKSAKLFKTYVIQKGEQIEGGKMEEHGKVVGFLYISNIEKVINDDESIAFKIFLNKISCKQSRLERYGGKLNSTENFRHPKNEIPNSVETENDDDLGMTSVEFGVCDNDETINKKPCSKKPNRQISKQKLKNSHRSFLSPVLFQVSIHKFRRRKNESAEILSILGNTSIEFEEKEDDHSIEFGTLWNRPANLPAPVTKMPKKESAEMEMEMAKFNFTNVDDDDDEDYSVDFGGCQFNDDGEIDISNQNSQSSGSQSSQSNSQNSQSGNQNSQTNTQNSQTNGQNSQNVNQNPQIQNPTPNNNPPLVQPPPQNPPFQNPFVPNFPPQFQAPWPNGAPFPQQFPPPPVGGPNGIFGIPFDRLSCFSGDTLVKTMDGKEKRMDELQIGDWVQSAGDERMGFNKIVSWLHRVPKVESEFLKFTLENGKTLKMTEKHFIYKTDCSANNTRNFSYHSIEAGKIRLTDCLLSLNHNEQLITTRIAKIETIRQHGIYAPLTDSGKIIVNGIFASCFSEIENQSLLFVFTNFNKYFNLAVRFLKNYFPSFFNYFQIQNDIALIPGIQCFINIVKIWL